MPSHFVSVSVASYTTLVPKLWTKTIEAHRREVRGAVLDVTARLVDEHGLRAVTMSQIADEAGVARATLYKYFGDVDEILVAWHDRQIGAHVARLADAGAEPGRPAERLGAVLEAYAEAARESRRHHHSELAAFLHRDGRVARAQRQVQDMIRDLVAEGAQAGELRDDIPPDELAVYCLNALGAGGSLPSKAAVRRLVSLTMDALTESLSARAKRD
jgi:AcrR family transcriptional regulator